MTYAVCISGQCYLVLNSVTIDTSFGCQFWGLVRALTTYFLMTVCLSVSYYDSSIHYPNEMELQTLQKSALNFHALFIVLVFAVSEAGWEKTWWCALPKWFLFVATIFFPVGACGCCGQRRGSAFDPVPAQEPSSITACICIHCWSFWIKES